MRSARRIGAVVAACALLHSAATMAIPQPATSKGANQRWRAFVVERARVISTLDDILEDRGNLTFEHKRDAIRLLGLLRASGQRSVGVLVECLSVERPPPPPHPYFPDRTPPEEYKPTPVALARIGLPAVRKLLSTLSMPGSSPGHAARAEEALAMMLGRAAAYWYEDSALRVAGEMRERLLTAARRAKERSLPRPPAQSALLCPVLWCSSDIVDGDAPSKSDLAAGMRSKNDAARFSYFLQVYGERRPRVAELGTQIADRKLPQMDRTSVAVTLGLIRGVSQESAEALVAMLAKERVEIGAPLDGEKCPAALALVRIGVPIVPVLTETVRISDNKKLRFNCVGVMATMLGRYAVPWLEDVRKDAPLAREKTRISEALYPWRRHCKGEGYYAEGGA